ncbi:HK97 gp10 family phage protein [Paenibacillus macerans]|uniref:HK97 gp10 family phage protein n=2 Tax=Bacillales TaxID=1385 RepID=UPI002DB71C39|nr:HK97 gp10 family phage protein [Paenibacillus macerans]MEC0328681.1 HK97 gp10 family phage protein [Paenibacillus macerans]
MPSNRIEFDTSRGAPFIRRVLGTFFRRYRSRLKDAVDDGSKRGMEDAIDEWRREATDLAPLKTGDLRRGISGEVKKDGDTYVGEVTATAVTTRGGRRFDYAAYIQDVYPRKYGETFGNPTTAGTIPRFIDVPAEEHEREWIEQIGREIKAELRRRGL